MSGAKLNFSLGNQISVLWLAFERWTEDCWNVGGNDDKPGDGRARTWEYCSARVTRGGSFGSNPRDLRSAYWIGSPSGDRVSYLGFRLARTLAP
jgi:formylglycine-generating enzyme required for sulfatase activity